MTMKGSAFAIAAVLALVLLGQATALKDDAFIGYLNGTNVAALGISTLDGTAATVGSAFLTLTDFGKNLTGWTLDKLDPLANPATLKLFYYNSSNAASPPKLLQLTTNFEDFSPFGDFTIATLNAALTSIGVAPVSGATPLSSLIKGRNLLGAWISTTGQATIGLITDDPNVGPPPPDYNEESYLSLISETSDFPGTGLVGAKATLSVIDNLDGTYAYEFFTDFATGAYNKTIVFPNGIRLVAQDATYGQPIPVLSLKFKGQDWLKAASDTGIEGTFTAAELNKGLQNVKGAVGSGSTITLFAQLDVSNIITEFKNYGSFDPAFDVTAPKKTSAPPPPKKKSPPSKAECLPPGSLLPFNLRYHVIFPLNFFFPSKL